MISRTRTTKPRFQLILIKPSHYDNDGYVVQWLRSTMPSNSLAAVFSLANGAAERQLLGPDLPIDVIAMDETNTRVKPKEIARRIADNGGLGFVGIVGVQSNEFPRAVDIARPLREAGVQVLIGGFHVSGCLAMLKELPDDIKEAQALGVSIYAGEAEEGLDEVILDAARRELRPLYDHMKHLPDIGDIAAPPFLPNSFIERTIGNVTSFDAGRGCPFQCSFCTIINVQGRKSRYRSAGQRREDHPHERRSGHQPLLHHRRQFRPQQGLGSDLRPDHQAARRGRHGRPLLHPGRHAVPQDRELHRQIEARRRHPRVHRAREHQPRQFDRRQEAAEQDHRVPQDAARVEAGRHHHLRGLHPRLRERHAGVDPPRPRDHQERAAARHARVLHSHAAARVRGPQGAARERASGWTPT